MVLHAQSRPCAKLLSRRARFSTDELLHSAARRLAQDCVAMLWNLADGKRLSSLES